MEHSDPKPWNEKRKLFHCLVFPLFMLFLMFSVRLIESLEGDSWYWLGIKPLSLEGLPGIITMPFKHGDWEHFYNNAISFLILSAALFYFYRPIGYKVFFTIYLFAGIWLWLLARDVWHVGASGLIYGLAAFLFFSGVFRRHIPLLAIALLVVFLYGGLVWGLIPMHRFITYSWEGHYWGAMAGLVSAIVFKSEGPSKPLKHWETVDDDGPDEGYWNQGTNENHEK